MNKNRNIVVGIVSLLIVSTAVSPVPQKGTPKVESSVVSVREVSFSDAEFMQRIKTPAASRTRPVVAPPVKKKPTRKYSEPKKARASKPIISTGNLGGDFARLRKCESGNHGLYRANTGNGYYGAYQFDRRTWRGLGFSGMPHTSSPATQDAAARRLQKARGWQPWPGCRKKLGLP